MTVTSIPNLFPSPPRPALPVVGETRLYPLHRIFCVGKNYAAHAAEMGGSVDREQPMFFTKSAFAYLPSGMETPYPPGTGNYHFEVEFCVVLGAPLFKADMDEAARAVYGYAVGLDMTRRDLQERLRDKAHPWDIAKDVEESAIIGPITRAGAFGPVSDQSVRLTLNGDLKQDGLLADMVWSVPELLSRLSHLYHLAPGDLLMTGTPAGVGPVEVGSKLKGEVTGLEPVTVRFLAAE